MKLSKKIYQCRKEKGYSQETLAEKVGVSRQAVSKWETGESDPEIGKLRLLAQIFEVSTDWLLSDDSAEETPREKIPQPQAAPANVEIPTDFLGRLFKRYGWLLGLYLATGGCVISAVGGFWFYKSRQLYLGSQTVWGSTVTLPPTYTMSKIVLIVGLVTLAAGIFLAIFLRKKRK